MKKVYYCKRYKTQHEEGGRRMNFKEIIVTTDTGEVIADITEENIIEKDGYKVTCIED